MDKKTIANAVGTLLSLDDKKYADLLLLPDDTLNQMYRNYIKNAQAYNHLEDENRELRSKLLESQGKYNMNKSLPPVDTPFVLHHEGDAIEAIRRSWATNKDRSITIHFLPNEDETVNVPIKAITWSYY